MTAVCRATKANGEGCKAPATGQHGFCWAHDPENAEKRRMTASKGGRAKRSGGVGEINDLKAEIRRVVDAVLDGRVERATGSVAFMGYNVLLRAAEVERKIRETDELEARIMELEREEEERPMGRWGS